LIAAVILGALGLWLMLPGTGGLRARMAGAAAAAAALGLVISQLTPVAGWLSGSIFYILAGVTILGALGTVTFRSPVYSAIWFGLTLLGTAGLFLFQGAQFLAVATLVVYAGAILVTFLFLLMLAQPEGRAAYDRVSWEGLLAASTGVVLVGVLSMAVIGALHAPEAVRPPLLVSEQQRAQGVLTSRHVLALGNELFSRHLIAVEVAGTLLLAALVGAAAIVATARGTRRPGAPRGPAVVDPLADIGRQEPAAQAEVPRESLAQVPAGHDGREQKTDGARVASKPVENKPEIVP
jgi:NADH-quinone oxidoreductase subunit J